MPIKAHIAHYDPCTPIRSPNVGQLSPGGFSANIMQFLKDIRTQNVKSSKRKCRAFKQKVIAAFHILPTPSYLIVRLCGTLSR